MLIRHLDPDLASLGSCEGLHFAAGLTLVARSGALGLETTLLGHARLAALPDL